MQEGFQLVNYRTWFIFLAADLVRLATKGDAEDAAFPTVYEMGGKRYVALPVLSRIPPLSKEEHRSVGYILPNKTGTRPWEGFENALPYIRKDVAQALAMGTKNEPELMGNIYRALGLEEEYQKLQNAPRSEPAPDAIARLRELVIERKLPVTFVSDLPLTPPPTA